MPLVESSSTAVLPAQPDWGAVLDQAGEGESFGHAVIHRAFSRTHFGALLQQLFYFGMNVKISRIGRQPFRELK